MFKKFVNRSIFHNWAGYSTLGQKIKCFFGFHTWEETCQYEITNHATHMKTGKECLFCSDFFVEVPALRDVE